MLPFMTVAVARTDRNPWQTSLYAGIFTAVIALIMVLLMGTPIVPALVGLLLGAAPIAAYQVTRGTFGSQWKPIIAGILGFVLFLAGVFLPAEAVGVASVVLALLSMILWPILVGAMMPEQSIGRLFLASLLGLILAVVVFYVVGRMMGQDPYGWTGLASILALSFWGGTVGAALSAWSR